MSAPRRYRKKPVEIEAVQLPWDPTDPLEGIDSDVLDDIATWCGGAIAWNDKGVPGVLITTLEGVMRADPLDWIIRGVKGEFYPCKPDIFEASYDAADDTEAAQ